MCLFLSTQQFNISAKTKTKIQTICVKIINKDKVLCIPTPTDRCLRRKTNKKQTNKQKNNGSYNGDNNMQLIYFTALICISPKTTNPSLTMSLPDPNTILKYLSAHSKHISCSLSSL